MVSVDESASAEELVFVLCRLRNHFRFEVSSSSIAGASSEGAEEEEEGGGVVFEGPGTGMGVTLATVVGWADTNSDLGDVAEADDAPLGERTDAEGDEATGEDAEDVWEAKAGTFTTTLGMLAAPRGERIEEGEEGEGVENEEEVGTKEEEGEGEEEEGGGEE